MKLLIATPSPYARKIRIMLHEKGLDVEEIVDNPWTENAAARQANPLGQVPVLWLDDGSVLYDSRVIAEYVETLNVAPRFFPEEPAARIAVKQIEALADGICDAVVLIVLERARATELQSADWIARQQRKVERGTAELHRLLTTDSQFGNAQITLADVAAGATLAYLDLRLPDFDWRSGYPALSKFSDRVETRPSFCRSRPISQTISPMR